jgi:glycosyltransferase involved in cell wall biosynthesis
MPRHRALSPALSPALATSLCPSATSTVGVLAGSTSCAAWRYSPPTRLIAEFTAQTISDPLEYQALRALVADASLIERIRAAIRTQVPIVLDGPLLLPSFGPVAVPMAASMVRGSCTVGYAVFEFDRPPPETISNARSYDAIATGSTWCTQVLKACGYENAHTIIQGVDPLAFHPCANAREYFNDRFVVFSGGKFEIRKAQDMVIPALAVMQQRHNDVVLVNAWGADLGYLQTMRSSQIRIAPSDKDFTDNYIGAMTRVLADNGLDISRVATFGPCDNRLMPHIYHNTDIGLFPSRCEGGTNLVLMEYMACGKPAIATFSSGHRDVLTEENSLPLKNHKPMEMRVGGSLVANWDEPSLDDIIERLEWAYQNRDKLAPLATRAAADMSQFTWERTTSKLAKLLLRQAD